MREIWRQRCLHNAQCLAASAFLKQAARYSALMAHGTGAAFDDYNCAYHPWCTNAMYLPKRYLHSMQDEREKLRKFAVIADAALKPGEE